MSTPHEIIDYLKIAAVAVDPAGKCHSNHRARHLLSADPRDTSELVELLAQERATVRDELSGALEEAGSADPKTLTITSPSGGEELELTIDQLGGETLLLLQAPEIDRRERAQAERLERLAAVGQLSAGVTHELNNVLTAILGWTQIALRDPQHVERVESALKVIDDNSRRAKAIIDDVLSIARDQSRAQGAVSATDVADEVLRVLSWELNNAEVAIKRSYLDQAVVSVDRRKLFQVFLNIVLNAIQAMPDGGELRVASRRGEGMIQLSFEDTGAGMDEETAARVFEQHFTTKEPTPGAGGGSGLGLAISRKLIHELDGEITLESAPDQGTRFAITLPSTGEESLKTSLDAFDTQRRSMQRNVLVVESEAAIRELITEALDCDEVTSTTNGIEALALCRRERFDVALLDYTMPGVSGRVLIERLRELQPTMRVIFLSGRPEEMSPDDVGGNAFLRKPFELSELYAVIDDES